MSKGSTDRFLSIKITRLLMKMVGFWTPETEKERRFLKLLQDYTVFAIAMALYIEACDFGISMGDFYALTYTACSTMPVITVSVKVGTFIYHRKRIMKMLRYTQDNFWNVDYDEFGTKVLHETEKRGLILISMFTFFVHGTVVSYILAPIIENIGKNESDRILPFNMWLGVPLEYTPYFEITFFVEFLALIHAGLCFCCFDNLFGILNIHAAAQFRILGRRLQKVFRKDHGKRSDVCKDKQVYDEFKACIVQHRTLISYMDDLEHIFTYATLCQLLISGVMLCVAGFQVFLGRGTFVRRCIFIAHTSGTFFQLFVTTWTANEAMIESRAIGDAAYIMDWEAFMSKDNQKIRTGIVIMMLRASKMSCITAGGFFPVSLETFMTVMSTAASYFALLRKFDTERAGES